MKQILPLDFFGLLTWIDGRPLLDTIEPYRCRIFTDTLTPGAPYNIALCGRAKKNWKTCDLILAALYRFLCHKDAKGNDCFLLANDADQAADDLTLLKKLISMNPLLADEVSVKQREIERNDGFGVLKVLAAGDAVGAHGKTYTFCGFDEIHGYRSWDIFEALASDPSRPDALTWITSYASVHNTPGYPLFDLFQRGKRGDDPRMYFSWYSGGYCTDPAFADLEPEGRANPSMKSWGNDVYLALQRMRLPSHKFRRLHLNLPGMPEGCFYDPARLQDAVVEGRRHLPRVEGVVYSAFVDMSGGSSDDATLGIAHYDDATKTRVLDLVVTQTGKAPFNPRDAVKKFAAICHQYGVASIVGDRYAGETFRADFADHNITYRVADRSKSELYEALEPLLNSGEIELLDVPALTEQLLGLTTRGAKIDHVPGEHDDLANAAAGALVTCSKYRGSLFEDWDDSDLIDDPYHDPVSAACARYENDAAMGFLHWTHKREYEE